MFRSLLVLVLVLVLVSTIFAQTGKVDPAYNPHRLIMSNIEGFAINAPLTGQEPRPKSTVYPDLMPGTDRIDKFRINLCWMENPPLAPNEDRLMRDLEAWAARQSNPATANPLKFAELVHYHSKLDRYLNRPVELGLEMAILQNVYDASGKKTGETYTNVKVVNYEFTVDLDLLAKPATMPYYYPGLPVGHTPKLVTVTKDTINTLPKPWANLAKDSYWQPVSLRAGFLSEDPQRPGTITLRFRRVPAQFQALGSLVTSRGKASVVASATYHGQYSNTVPCIWSPPWLKWMTNGNWTSTPVDFLRSDRRYAYWGQTPVADIPLPEFETWAVPTPTPTPTTPSSDCAAKNQLRALAITDAQAAAKKALDATVASLTAVAKANWTNVLYPAWRKAFILYRRAKINALMAELNKKGVGIFEVDMYVRPLIDQLDKEQVVAEAVERQKWQNQLTAAINAATLTSNKTLEATIAQIWIKYPVCQ